VVPSNNNEKDLRIHIVCPPLGGVMATEHRQKGLQILPLKAVLRSKRCAGIFGRSESFGCHWQARKIPPQLIKVCRSEIYLTKHIQVISELNPIFLPFSDPSAIAAWR
jgi:hypothetical protein